VSPGLRARLRGSLVRLAAPVSEKAFRERPRVRVIAFHDIPERDRDSFVEKIAWLARTCRLVSVADAHDRAGLDEERLNVALTFDDGFAEHAAFAAPVLVDLDVPAVFFVPSGALDLSPTDADRFSRDGLRRQGSFRFMSERQLGELAGHPLFEIGGHTTDHADLGSLGDQQALDGQIVRDKAALERLTGAPLRWFAFPFGSSANVSARALHTLAGAGYQAAFTIVPGFWSRGQPDLLVGRDSLWVGADDDLWRSSLSGGADALGWIKHHRRLRTAASG
jgi:peptidoglycan/xylan/chitin deacetylase (PgdA/CDA1 family)